MLDTLGQMSWLALSPVVLASDVGYVANPAENYAVYEPKPMVSGVAVDCACIHL